VHQKRVRSERVTKAQGYGKASGQSPPSPPFSIGNGAKRSYDYGAGGNEKGRGWSEATFPAL